MESSTLYFLFSLLFLVATFKFLAKGNRKLPPSPILSLPLLGHLHLLKLPLHRTYNNLSKKLGPIFSLNLGTRLVVVVSSPAIVEECFRKNDVVLANRPRFLTGKYIGYNYTSLANLPYGDHWRNLHRLTSAEIFSSARLNMFQAIREDEIRLMMKNLCRDALQDFAIVEIRPLLFNFTLNNIMRMMAGKRYFGVDEVTEEAKEREFRQLVEDVFAFGSVASLGDFFPAFSWIDYNGLEKNLVRISGKMDVFLQGLIDELRCQKEGNTLIHHLLSLQESEPQHYTDTMIKSLIVVMLLGGTDTSSVTIEWAMSALLNHPEKLEKARAEIDNTIGCDRVVNESDLAKLPYLQNIISETSRLFPAGPLLAPHEASSDCKIAGYDIPKGTIVQVNAWAIHRDPNVWDDPMTFKPERFEAGEVGPPKLLPFGMGRRSCPGIGLAQRIMGLVLGCLIQCFDWQRIDERLVDLREGKGLAMPKNIPLEAKCKARLVLRKALVAAG